VFRNWRSETAGYFPEPGCWRSLSTIPLPAPRFPIWLFTATTGTLPSRSRIA
jgi:hypothetical protein